MIARQGKEVFATNVAEGKRAYGAVQDTLSWIGSECDTCLACAALPRVLGGIQRWPERGLGLQYKASRQVMVCGEAARVLMESVTYRSSF